jgi:class 3 adenylate cyclase
VFTLLENIYGAMDKEAKKLGVFKVETIGDCYVAATGIPEQQENHVEIMMRFARICCIRVINLTRQLEAVLGPGTSDLAMRFGIHSGPVTAGVLRGQKARCELLLFVVLVLYRKHYFSSVSKLTFCPLACFSIVCNSCSLGKH